MAGWRKRWEIFTSFVICAAVVVVGTLLYPLVLLFFSIVALVDALRRRPESAPSSGRQGSGGEAARR